MITIVFSAISPAFAYSATDGFSPVSFWEYVYRGFGGGNRDGGFGGGGFGGSDPDSWTTSDDMKNDYNDFVSTLPATGYDSAGKLLWQPRWIEDTKSWGLYIYGSASMAKYPDIGVTSTDYVSATVNGAIISLNVLENNARLSVSSSTWVGPGIGGNSYNHYFRAPIVGIYTRLSSDSFSGSFFTNSGASQLQYKWTAATVGNLGVGDIVDCGSTNSISLSSLKAGTFNLCTPVYQIEPYTPTVINNTYNINTRVNNFQGNYYNNVTNNYYNNTTIINETTNNYYDMTTNNYYTMSNWSYDYQSRTYFVTLEDGTTITVQFGDDCLTITNNNVENSYQYVINNNNTPSPNPETPSTCKHNWTETIDVAPTCLEGGHANFTCSLCGETYEQILSAKGHNWTVKEHVNTVYGESGVIVTQGHTLYECSACGEQWYTETATPPPDVSGGSNILAWLQEFKTWLGDKLDNLFQGDGDTNNFWNTNKKSFTDVLSSLLQTLLDFLTDILEKLLGLVKDLLSFLFDLLSSVVITGISDFFTGLKDSRLFDFVTKDDEGSAVALPEGVAAVFAFFSGVILALPVELRSILLFGTALIVLIGVIKIIKS